MLTKRSKNTPKTTRGEKLGASLKMIATSFMAVSLFLTIPLKSAHAVDIIVNSLEDSFDLELCSNEDCTIREAVTDASAGDTIILPEGVIDLYVNEINISSDLTIRGQGINATTLNATYESDGVGGFLAGAEPPPRIFNVAEGVNLTLQNLELNGTRGVREIDLTFLAPIGGCIFFEGNPAPETPAILDLSQVRIRDCEALGGGGGIAKSSTHSAQLNGTELEFSNNNAENGAGIVWAEFEDNPNSSVHIQKSSFQNNAPSMIGFGGGIIIGLGVQATIENTTFSGNDNAITVLAPAAAATNSSLVLNHVTIANDLGVGIYAVDNSSVEISNSILGPQEPGVPNCEIEGTAVITSNGHNIGAGDNTCNLDVALNDQPNKDPLLGDFTNGHFPLLEGSPAIDTASSSLTEDQLDNPRPSGGASDIGAIEVQQPSGGNTGGTSGGEIAGGGCSLAASSSFSSSFAWMGLALISLFGVRRLRK